MSTQLEEHPAPSLVTVADVRRRRRWSAAAIVVVLAAIAGAALVVSGDDDATSTQTTATTASSTTTVTQTSATSTPTTPLPTDGRTAVFPLDGRGFETPIDAATAFVLDLGFRAPVVGDFRQGDSRSGEIEVRPIADGPLTTVFVRQLGAGDRWFVLGSAAASIQLDDPDVLDEITSPVRLRGTSTAFEANVNVEIRQDVGPHVLGTGFVMGGANGEMGPFDGSVAFEEPAAAFGAIVLRTFSMEDGSTWEASVVRVAFPATTPATTTVQVFFHTDPDGAPVAFHRTVPATRAVLHAALEQLLAGPTDSELRRGVTSWFSPATADLLVDVTLEGGVAVVDFADLRPVIPNASSSSGSEMLLSELDATVFQFETVESVVYRIDGEADAFYEWLQLSAPEGAEDDEVES